MQKKQYDAALLGPNMRVLEGDNLERTRSSNWQPSIIQKIVDVSPGESGKARCA